MTLKTRHESQSGADALLARDLRAELEEKERRAKGKGALAGADVKETIAALGSGASDEGGRFRTRAEDADDDASASGSDDESDSGSDDESDGAWRCVRLVSDGAARDATRDATTRAGRETRRRRRLTNPTARSLDSQTTTRPRSWPSSSASRANARKKRA